MARYYRLAVQPEVRYIAGYGISRAGFPDEWTPCPRVPEPEHWHAWACKAENATRRYYKAKGGMLVMRGTEWFWCVEDDEVSDMNCTNHIWIVGYFRGFKCLRCVHCGAVS